MSSVQKQTTTQQVTQKSTETTGVTQSSTMTSRQTNCVQITKRGFFFDDAFFEDSRNDFRNAISNVVSRFGDKSSSTDELTQYRSLRSRDLRDENQAIISSQDDNKYKIVVDVQDFVNGGEINVKVVEEREVVVQGKVQRVEGNMTSSKSFQRSFILPEDVDVDTLNSVMSADGVLTITAIRRTVTQQLTQVPVTIQKQVTTTTTSTTGVQETPVPIPDQTVSVEKKVTKVTQQTTSSTEATTPQSPEKPLPIAKKGDFFQDSFFENTRQQFQTAVKEVLQKMNIQTSNTDEISTYRNLRQRELREETQAATVDEDQSMHKVVVDVQDFANGGEVNVKVVNEREVIIEGHVEKKEGNTTSTKRFRKRYVLPEDIEVEKVTSVMSSDGVLTITTPKKPSTQQLTEVPVNIQKIENKQVTTTTTSTTGVQETPAPVVPAQPVQPVQDTDQTISVEKKITKVTQQTTSSTEATTPQSPEKPLPIAKKGDFFQDSFFENTRQQFQTAVKEVLQKMNIQTSNTDEISTYRNLRQRELREETQAATVAEDQSMHKVVVDVQDFVNGGEVNVKVVNEREVIIEGHVEKKEGNTTSTKRFRKRYVLPEDIEVEKVTSVMSADGVLTVTTPKKPTTQQLTENPVTIQKIENKKITTTTTSTTGVEETPAPVQPVQPTQPVQPMQDTDQTISVEKKITKVTQQTTSSTEATTPQSPEKPLPIAKKGDFFQDSFFENTRQQFQTAVKEVLQKMNIQTSTTDEISTYRNLRQRELREETQAATVDEDQSMHKIVVDVQDFVNGGEVNVKVVNEREVIIEGHVEKKEGNTTSTKRFRKRYVLPEDIEVEKVTSVMSADGVLTITTPKKPQQLTQAPVTIQKIENKKVTTSTTSTTGVQETPVPTQPVEPAQPAQDIDQTISVKKVTKITQETSSTDATTPQSPEKPLPIAKKGDFFQDSFFENTRQQFQTAVKEVLQKMNIQTSTTDEISTYRNLRQRELREETQAASADEDQSLHKIVVDAHDFVNGGEVIVKIVNEREVIIEGHIEKVESNKTSMKRFRKHYILPENIEVEKVTSVMSSDGILTITTPKKTSTQQLTQINVQKIESNQQQQKSITQETKKTESTTVDVPGRVLQIIRKGNFFSDTFFEDCRQHFQTAVTEILRKLNIETSTVDIMTTYRTVRQRELKEETQAVTEKDTEQVRKFVVDVQDFANGGEVTVKIVQEREVVVEGRVDRLEGGVTSTKRFRKTFILSESIQTDSVTAVMSADGILTITAPKKVTQQKQIPVEKPAAIQPQKPGEDRVLPVNKKGSFFSDTYFQDSRQDFQTAVKEVVMKSSEKDSKEDQMTIYRSLRQKAVKLENQAVNVKEDAQFQKIVLDVLDFVNGEVKVMITSENILVVEGRGTRQEGVKTSSHSFLRRFIVPDNVIPESIEASLSSDGILTIYSRKQ